MAKNSHTHVVYGFRVATPEPRQEPDAMGFGKSDNQALRDAIKNGGPTLFYFYIRSNGDRVPVSAFPDEIAKLLG